jgi:hypothetical protein
MAPYSNVAAFPLNLPAGFTQSVEDTTAVYQGDFEIFSQLSDDEYMETLESGFGAGERFYRGPADVDDDYLPSDDDYVGAPDSPSYDSDDEDPIPPWVIPGRPDEHYRYLPEPSADDIMGGDEDDDIVVRSEIEIRQERIEGGRTCMVCEEVHRSPDTIIAAVCRECNGRLCTDCQYDFREREGFTTTFRPTCPYCDNNRIPFNK